MGLGVSVGLGRVPMGVEGSVWGWGISMGLARGSLWVWGVSMGLGRVSMGLGVLSMGLWSLYGAGGP